MKSSEKPSPAVEESAAENPAADRAAATPENLARQPWRIVAGREIAVTLRSKAFIFTNVLIICIMIGAYFFSAAQIDSSNKATISTTAAGTPIVSLAKDLATASGSDIKLDLVSSTGDAAAVKASIKDGKADIGLVQTNKGWQLISKDEKYRSAAELLSRATTQAVITENANQDGVDLAKLQRNTTVPYVLLETDDGKTAVKTGSTLAYGALFYLLSLLFGMTMASSVIAEKQSRLVEIIASSIPIRQLLLGKVAGNMLLALGQLIVFGAIGFGVIAATGHTDVLPQIGLSTGVFFAFFLCGFALLAMLFAVSGALGSRVEDLQSTTTPVTLAVIFLVILPTTITSGIWQIVMSYAPITSVVAMPSRVAGAEAAWWEVLLSLGITLASAYLVLRIASRLYARSALHSGEPLNLKKAFQLSE